MGRGRRHWLLPMLLGGLAAVAGLAFVVASLPYWGDRSGYRRARPCAGAGDTGCVRDVTGVVESTRAGRRGTYEVTLRLATGVEQVDLPDPEPVFAALAPGGRVTVRLWDGRAARIEVAGVGAVETEHSPLVEPVTYVVSGTTLAFGGGVGGYVGMDRRRQPRRHPGAPASLRGRSAHAETGRVVFAGFFAALFTYLSMSTLDVYDVRVLAATFGALSGSAWAVLRRVR